jgi:hypothetical protein
MPNYSSTSSNGGGTRQATSSSYKTQEQLTSSSTTQARRGKVYDLLIGADGTPADNAIQWDISRCTTVGTGTATTPNPLDPADEAALIVCTSCLTVEPTVTANSSLFNLAINQRASYRWVANPGSELVIPATNLNGLAFRALSAGYTGTLTITALHAE